MTTFAFHAACVVCEHPDGEYHLIGFADREYDTEVYLMLQRSFADDEQDVRLGMDTYHVEWCDQGSSGYGGVSRFVLKTTSAEVQFEPQMAELLGGIEHLSISFDLPAGKHRVLREALQHVFAESKCLEIADT
ncbi:MAG: hypothetical protein JNN30_00120 [Rhodanobacteraceae bacterium]|nr:hypothetical protein [Rhodanobacteraceae bacterium]